MKALKRVGSSKENLSAFPKDVKDAAGHQLFLVQHGEDPDDWKPMKAVGRGVREIRIRGADGAYRVFYLASLKSAVYVLHAFKKTTRKTPQGAIDLAKRRLGDALADERQRTHH